MCDRLILDGNDEKYICDDCWAELNEVKNNWPSETTALNVRNIIIEFMDTPVGTYRMVVTADEFRRITYSDRE